MFMLSLNSPHRWVSILGLFILSQTKATLCWGSSQVMFSLLSSVGGVEASSTLQSLIIKVTLHQHLQYPRQHPSCWPVCPDPHRCWSLFWEWQSCRLWRYNEDGTRWCWSVHVCQDEFKIINLIYMTQSLIGRATRVFEVERNKRRYILKMHGLRSVALCVK